MKKTKSMIYIIIGLILTGFGVGFTIIGTFKQGKEAQEFQSQVIESQNKSIELSEKLTKISEDKFHQLTKPIMNVVEVEENLDLELNSYLKITAKNTGNNDCLNAHLLVDRHNSPWAKPGSLTIQNFTKVPKDAIVIYKIPLFQSEMFDSLAKENQKNEFSDFIKRYNEDKTSIVIFFHFEYEWNNETLKSSQYSIVKTKNRFAYISSSEEYVESEVEMPKLKK